MPLPLAADGRRVSANRGRVEVADEAGEVMAVADTDEDEGEGHGDGVDGGEESGMGS